MIETVQIVNREQIDAAFARLESYSPMRRLADGLRTAWRARLRARADAGVEPELTEHYAQEKLKDVGPKPILTRTGAMWDAFLDSSATDAVDDLTDDSLTLGATGRAGEIASAHQEGTDRLPARPIFTSLMVEEFKEQDVKTLMVADLTEYAREISVRA